MTTTRVIRIEHSVVTREVMGKDYPAGPYAESAILRWEHGEGVYSWDEDLDCDGSCIHEWVSRFSWDCSDRRPTPDAYVTQDLFFAFRDVESLRDWFLGEFARLRRYGFVASVYEVPEQAVRHEAQQTLFRFDEAMLVGSTEPNNYKQMEKWLSNA